jgi:S-adenosylmethionine-diacylgycerolhomoserine-N-methlytransferase
VIEALDPPPVVLVLEIGCGTGRNLAVAARRWPDARLHGVDISREMLGMARARVAREGLEGRVRLAEADAQALDARALFGVDGFDRAFFSYTLSMVPDWRAALTCALAALKPEGRLHVVDFGQQAGLPRAFRAALTAWLGLFHVRPDPALADGFRAAAEAAGRPVTHRAPYRDYCWLLTAGPAPAPG